MTTYNLTAREAYTLVALKGAALDDRLQRGANGCFEFYEDINGVKYILKLTRDGENYKLIIQELHMLRLLNEAGAQVPALHPDYQDDSWGQCEGIAMVLLDNAATVGDYCEAYLESKIPLSILKEIILACKEAIESVHETGVIHNDLHGNNIVLTLSGGKFKAYVIDFGWSFLESKGIPGWMKRERTWWAEEPDDDIQYLMKDLEGRTPPGDEEDKEYLGVIALLDR